MAEEQTSTTETKTSETTPKGDADATKPASTTDAGNGDGESGEASLLAAATADAGTGGDGSDDKADDKTAVGDTGGDDKADDSLPEKYELAVTVKDADGKDQQIEMDPALVDEASPIFKELGLGNEQANKIAALVPKVQERLAQQQQDQFAAVRADWAKQTKDDPDIGGKNWKETTGLVARTLDHYAGSAEKNADGTYKSDFRQLLEDTGLTNHPAMAKMLREIGRDLSEDGNFARGDAKPEKKPREEVMYPNDVKK